LEFCLRLPHVTVGGEIQVSLLITCSAYDLRAGIDDGLAEFGIKANIAVSKTISTPSIIENSISIILFIIFCHSVLHNLKSFLAVIKEEAFSDYYTGLYEVRDFKCSVTNNRHDYYNN